MQSGPPQQSRHLRRLSRLPPSITHQPVQKQLSLGAAEAQKQCEKPISTASPHKSRSRRRGYTYIKTKEPPRRARPSTMKNRGKYHCSPPATHPNCLRSERPQYRQTVRLGQAPHRSRTQQAWRSRLRRRLAHLYHLHRYHYRLDYRSQRYKVTQAYISMIPRYQLNLRVTSLQHSKRTTQRHSTRSAVQTYLKHHGISYHTRISTESFINRVRRKERGAFQQRMRSLSTVNNDVLRPQPTSADRTPDKHCLSSEPLAIFKNGVSERLRSHLKWNDRNTCSQSPPVEQSSILKRAMIQLLLNRGGIEPNPGPIAIYFEQQELQFCQVHALNAALGFCLLTGHELLLYCTQQVRLHRAMGSNAIWPLLFNEHTGNFGTPALNHWLERFVDPPLCIATLKKVYPRHLHSVIPEHSTKLDILHHLIPHEVDCFILQANNDRNLLNHDSGGHATCVKKIQGDWYHIDSQKLGPALLRTDAEWGCLRGAVHVVVNRSTRQLNIHGDLDLPLQMQPREQIRHNHIWSPIVINEDTLDKIELPAHIPQEHHASADRQDATFELEVPTYASMLARGLTRPEMNGETATVATVPRLRQLVPTQIKTSESSRVRQPECREVADERRVRYSRERPTLSSRMNRHTRGTPSAKTQRITKHTCVRAHGMPPMDRAPKEDSDHKNSSAPLMTSAAALQLPSILHSRCAHSHSGTRPMTLAPHNRSVTSHLKSWTTKPALQTTSPEGQEMPRMDNNVASVLVKRVHSCTISTATHPSTCETAVGSKLAQQTPTSSTKRQHLPEKVGDDSLLRIMTLNCRGIMSNETTLGLIIETHLPHIIFLTETKLVSNQNKPPVVKSLLHEYQWGVSSTTRKSVRRDMQQPNAGVIIAVHNDYSNKGRLVTTEPPIGLAGFVCHATMMTANAKKLHLIGVYAPADVEMRHHIFEYVEEQCKLCRLSQDNILIGGDWNAVLHRLDRNTGLLDAADRAFHAFVSQTKLAPLHTHKGCTPRLATYTQLREGAEAHKSRIDDVLTLEEVAVAMTQDPTSIMEEVPDIGGNLDHNPLIHYLRHAAFTLPRLNEPASDHQKRACPTFVLPIHKSHLLVSSRTIATMHATSAAELRQKTSAGAAAMLKSLKGDHTASSLARLRNEIRHDSSFIDTLADELQMLLSSCLKTMQSICPVKIAGSGIVFLKNGVQRQHRKLYERKLWLRGLLRNYGEAKGLGSLAMLPQHLHSQKHPGDKLVEGMPHSKDANAEWDAWKRTVDDEISVTTRAFRTLNTEHRQGIARKERKEFQKKLATRPRLGHRELFNKNNGEPGGPHSIRHPVTGEVHHTPDGVLRSLHTYHAQLMTPSSGPKNGLYQPHDVPRNPPWSQQGAAAMDPFTLDTLATQKRGSAQLLNHLLDRATLDESLEHLARSKCAGEDGVPNELLQILPEDAKRAIHDLFVLMWITGRTPTAWKRSSTILLFKKGDELEASNYRPIAISNTLYKLWTGTVTTVLTTYAEAHNMISSVQEGFRSHKNTGRQLRNLIQVIEDASLTGSNLYMLYIDFSSAFNMVDHDKLLCIMFDLGFPEDAIDTVKDIYTNSVTQIRVAGASSHDIAVDRGTIQGDTLSPFLFLIFLEPLLRWLHVGGRGYNYGCLTDPLEKLQHRCSSLAYADDLNIPAGTIEDLVVQAEKLDRYCVWSGLRINGPKCCVTGVLYGDYAQRKITSVDSPSSIASIKQTLEGAITLGGTAIPFLPPNKPYKYLGAQVTLTLDWSHQLASTIKLAMDKGDVLASSLASYRQRLHVIQTCIKPGITYCFGVAPYTEADISTLDKLVIKIAKGACRLPSYTPNAAMLLNKDESGLGVTSLWVDYVQLNVASLVRALNDKGRLGAVTRGLLKLQNNRVGDMMQHGTEKHGKFYMALRQLAMCKAHSIKLMNNGMETQVQHNRLWAELSRSSEQMTENTLKRLHLDVWHPLSELDVKLSDLLTESGTHVISTLELQARLGHSIQQKHKIALNRVTLILTRNFEPGSNPSSYRRAAPLGADIRSLPKDWLPRETWQLETLVRTPPVRVIKRPLHEREICPSRQIQSIQAPRRGSKDDMNGPSNALMRAMVRFRAECDWNQRSSASPFDDTTTQMTQVDQIEASLTPLAATPILSEARLPVLTYTLPPRDISLTNRQRQGDWLLNPTYTVERDTLRRSTVSLVCTPVNPDRDIAPPNTFVTQMGLRPKGSMVSSHNHTAFVYLPSGRYVGEMTNESHKKLSDDHRRAELKGSGELRNVKLDEALAQLLMRYPTKTDPQECVGDMVAPEGLVRGAAALGMTHEYFASPLDHSKHLYTYSSRYSEDKVFGSQGDAFSRPWEVAGFVHPGKTYATLTKAVRWAISSATLTAEAVCNILLLPRGPESKHNLYLGHPYVYDMGTINNLTFTKPNFWCCDQSDQQMKKPDRSQYKLFLVANPRGMKRYLSGDTEWANFAAACSSCLGLDVIRPVLMTQTSSHHRNVNQFKHPKALLNLIKTPLLRMMPNRQRCLAEPNNTHWQRPLAVDPMSGVYTDGSCIKQQGAQNKLGAAIKYCKNERTHTVSINPCGHGATNTINRAELSAIHIALTTLAIAEAHEDLIIYTDSQCSIQMINKMLYQPARMMESKHLPMLDTIVEAIDKRSTAGGKTTIQKVKSHAGILGNEAADKAATAVAKGLTPASNCIDEWVTSQAYGHITWPAISPLDNREEADVYFCGDLSAAIKNHLMPTLQTGKCNNTTYVQLNKKSTQSSVNHSNYMWDKGSNIPFQTAKLVFKLRWGLTFHQGRAVQFKHKDRSTGMSLTDAACLLCGRHDGPSHIFGGCKHPHIKAHIISRHNKAVLLIHKAVTSGDMGGSFCVVDATKRDNLPDGVAGTRLPEWLLPHMDAVLLAKKRPDILMIKGLPARTADVMTQFTVRERARLQSKCTVLIIEVGYASDFRYDEKLLEKNTQHAELATELQRSGWKVIKYTMILGIGGTIHRDIGSVLDKMGIPVLSKTKCLRDLHCLAAVKVRDVLRERQKLQMILPAQSGVG